MQGWDGLWRVNHVAAILSLLERSDTFAAGLAVLRTVPSLIRYQGKDGLWDLGRFPDFRSPRDKRFKLLIPRKDVTSYLILKCLKKFGFLDALVPE